MNNMGIQNYRKLKNFEYINIAICIYGQVIFFLKKLGYEFDKSFASLKEVNKLTAFILIAASIRIISVFINKTKGFSEGGISKVKSKIKIYKSINILLIGYIFFCIIIRDVDLLISSCIVEASYLASVVYTRKMYEMIITDNELRCEKVKCEDKNIDVDFGYSSALWRYKIWFSPFEHVPMDKRYINKYYYIGIIIELILLHYFSDIVFCIVIFFMIFIQLLKICEYTFGLYTSITGICTGVEKFTERNSNEDYYRVYVTDFEHKRELVFETYDCMTKYKNTNVKVIHSIFSKEAIMINNTKIIYR